MAAAARTVHVYSVIPRLAQVVQEQLSGVTVVNVDVKENISEEDVKPLRDAEILLTENTTLQQMYDQLPKLQWMQCTWAGIENLVKFFQDKPKPTYPVSRMASDTFSQLMAEYAVGWIISHERSFLQCRQNQLKSVWKHEGSIGNYRCLSELTVGILGLGNIGKVVARSLKPFGTTIHAFTRTPPASDSVSANVDKYWHGGELGSFLQHSDYIISILPSTAHTRGLLGGDTLSGAKSGAVLMNLGRGDVVGEADLVKALDAGWISAAILDVFTSEPLPPHSPLWTHPRVVVTPHCSGTSRTQDVAQAFTENYQRVVQGLPPQHLINWETGY